MTRVLFGAIMVLAALVMRGAAADDVDRAIAALKAAGTGDEGNRSARDAWRRLSSADAAALPAILAALDDAGPLSANWLRSAADAIAEGQLQHGGDLPVAALESFAVDTRHAPRARRLAYEWLLRVDAAAERRLIPNMLDDPSLEFRRDAVARLLKQAEAQSTAGDNASATATFRQALTAARDADQVQQIVKRLDELGVKIDLAQHFGYLLSWKLIGPFDNTDEQGYEVVYPPEEEADFAKQYAGKSAPVRWIDYTSEDPRGKVNFNQALEKATSVTGYAAAEFIAAAARPVEVRWQTMNATKVWLNGKLLGAHRVYHSGSQMDQYIARGELQNGRNLILVKLCQNEQKEEWAQDWDFQLRVCDESGAAVRSQERETQTTGQAVKSSTDPARK